MSLLQILENGGGAGEMEEAMMWHSIEREKSDDFDRLPAGPSPQRHGQVGEEGQWTDVYVSLSFIYIVGTN